MKPMIGLEIHVQLNTKSKLFCSCSTGADAVLAQREVLANSLTCPTCLGHPGSKPVLNAKALEFGIKVCLALGCKIEKEIFFSRKTYFYPDLAKNYQITQYEVPLGREGGITLSNGKLIRLRRVHIEEDPAMLVHPAGISKSSFVLIDYNRSGIPLIEIVTEPDIESAEAAREFMNLLIALLKYIKVFDPNTGVIKADVNVSININEVQGSRVEIKNISGAKEIERAIIYELLRQTRELEEGNNIIMETRLWDANIGKTESLRKKETEMDYGYIFEPDLPRIKIDSSMMKAAFAGMPELPKEKSRRLIKEYKITEENAIIFSYDALLANLFEKLAQKVKPELASNWLRHEIIRVLNYRNKTLETIKDLEGFSIQLEKLLMLLDSRKINEAVAKKVLELLAERADSADSVDATDSSKQKSFDVENYISSQELFKISDASTIETVVNKVLSENKQAVEDYKAGRNEKAINFIIGKIMREMRGKADSDIVKALVMRKINQKDT